MGGLTTNSQAGPSRGTRSRRKKSNLKAPPADHRTRSDRKIIRCELHGPKWLCCDECGAP